jgi:hypothetical protein
MLNQKLMRTGEANSSTSAPSKYQTHTSVANDPEKAYRLLGAMGKERKAQQQQKRRLLAKLQVKKDGMDLNPGEEQDTVNEAIIEVDKVAQEVLAKNGFDNETLERMIWDEAVENAKRIKASGERSVAR